MDIWLLEYFNMGFTHPLLDLLMVLLTTVGLGLLPLFGIWLLWRGQRQTGWSVLIALVVAGCLTLAFYYLAMRPRPSATRLLLPTPPFPSFPSGHAAGAFAVATLLSLRYRRPAWSISFFAFALLIALSRLYLGHHYPSDVLGGTILGIGIGAAVYGVMIVGLNGQGLRWLLWPQIAVVVLVTQMAYLDRLPSHLLAWPYADKAIHFLLFGAVTFWLNLWVDRRRINISALSLPLAIAVPFTLAFAEESYQYLSPLRTADVVDLASDLLGMVCFWYLSEWVLSRFHRQIS